MLKKLFEVLFVFVLGFAFLSFVNFKSNATLATSDKIVVNGAGVRTTGNSGIRFEASYDEFVPEESKSIAKYGIALAYGKVEASDSFVKNGTINDNNIAFYEQATLDDGDKLYVIVWNIPEDSYFQSLTARAYVVLSDDSVVYGAVTKTRDLGSIVIKADNDSIEGDIITEVLAAVDKITLSEEDIDVIESASATKYVSSSITKKYAVFSTDFSDINTYIKEGIYATLDSAIATAKNNEVIYLLPGEYTMTDTTTKTPIKIVGPNYGVKGTEARSDEATIEPKGTYNIKLASIEFDGVRFASTTGNVSWFYPNSTCTNFVVKNSIITSVADNSSGKFGVNSFLRDQYHEGGIISVEITDCKFNRMDQFVLNVGYSGCAATCNVTGCYFTDSEEIGSQLFRIQAAGTSCVINVMDCNFDGDLVAGVIAKAQAGNINLQFNTFNNVTKYVTGDNGSVTFNNNLYITNKVVKDSAHANVTGKNVTADSILATSNENRLELYSKYLTGSTSEHEK